jgi:hypothetical protein
MLQRDNHDWRLTMLSAIREVQIPLLAAMLLAGCGTKAVRVLRTREMGAALGPTALFPLRLRRPIAIGLCATEMGLGIALILTAGRFGAGLPATLVRAGMTLLFLIAVGALAELRERRPDAGCGCFGDLSVTPVGPRTIARSVLLAVAAVATVGQAPLTMPASASAAAVSIGLLGGEFLLIALLSPEIGEAMIRLGYSEPCEIRRVSVERTLSSLTGSAPWRRYASTVTSAAPADIWREGCWRYVLYRGEMDDRSVDVVFAIYLRSRRPQVRAAVLDAVTNEVLTGLPARTRAAQDPRGDRSAAGEQAGLDDVRGQIPGQIPGLDGTWPLCPQPQVAAPRPLDVTRPLAPGRPLTGLTAPGTDDRRPRIARHRSSVHL